MQSVTRIIFLLHVSVVILKYGCNIKVIKPLLRRQIIKELVILIYPFVLRGISVSSVVVNRPYRHEHDMSVSGERDYLINQFGIGCLIFFLIKPVHAVYSVAHIDHRLISCMQIIGQSELRSRILFESRG